MTEKNGRGRGRAMRGAAALLALLLAACGGGGGGGGSGGTSGTPPSGGMAGPRAGADYFPLTPGDRWMYVDESGATSSARVTTTQTVTGGTAMVLQTMNGDGPGTELYLKLSTGVTVVPAGDADGLAAAIGSVQRLRLPLAQGSRWVVVDKTLPVDVDGDGRLDTLAVNAEATVVGFESLSTQAGDFSDVAHVQTVLTQTAKLAIGGPDVIVTTTADDWYAPDVGPVKSRLVTTAGTKTFRADGSVKAWRVGSRRSESIAPLLSSMAPAAQEVAGGCCVALSATFNEVMDTFTDRGAIWQLIGPDGKPVAGQVHWSADARTASFVPAGALSSGKYGAALTIATQDWVGNPLATEQRWEFTVDASGPAVTPVQPLADAQEVALDSKVVFTLDEDVDAASVRDGNVTLADLTASSFVDAQLSLSGRTVTLTPSAPLKPGDQYRVNVIGVLDKFGNASAASWTFYADPGRFARPQRLLPEGVAVTATAAGRLFNDGRTSVVLATGYNSGTWGDFKLLVLRAQPDGKLAEPQRYDTMAAYGANITSLIVADLDGGGHRAVVVGSSGLGVQVFRPQADGGLALTQTLQTSASYVVRLADLDGDGRLDLIGRPFLGDSVTVWMQAADGRFGAARTVTLEADGFGSLAVGDINGDGRPDIISVGNESLPGHEVGVAYQQADGGFGAPRYIAAPAGAAVKSVAVGDLNGDGRVDLVLGLQFADSVGVMLQTAQGELAPISVVKSGPSVGEVEVADIDGDGRQDVVSIGFGGWPVALHRQRIDGSLGGAEIFPVSTYGLDGPGLLAVGDLDGDGLLDIAYSGVWLRQRAVPPTTPPAPMRSNAVPAKRLGQDALRTLLRR